MKSSLTRNNRSIQIIQALIYKFEAFTNTYITLNEKFFENAPIS